MEERVIESQRLFDFLETVLAETNARTIWAKSQAFFAGFGFDGLFLADLGPAGDRVWSNVPADWATTRGAAKASDPFFDHCCNTLDPMLTGPDFLHRHPHLTEVERRFIRGAAETGFVAGLALPLRTKSREGMAGWHLLSSHGGDAVEAAALRHGRALRLAAAVVHQTIGRAGPPSASRPPAVVALTPRERDCLTLSAEGCRSQEIADRLGIAVVTVELHLRNARARLGALTREQAVAMAIRQGLLA